jgi:hypothetical protein
MFIAALFLIAKMWNQPTYLSTDEWIKKMYIHKLECYSTIKKNKITLFSGKWMNLEIIMFSKIRQSEKYK